MAVAWLLLGSAHGSAADTAPPPAPAWEDEDFTPETVFIKTYRDAILAEAKKNPEAIKDLPEITARYADWEDQFRRLIRQLKKDGYRFGNLESFDPETNEKTVYLRFDIHDRDIVPTFTFFPLIDELEIPAVFFLNYKMSPQEEAESDAYKIMKPFESEYVRFGLHASPTSSVLVYQEFERNMRAFVKEIRHKGQATEQARKILRKPFSGPVTLEKITRHKINMQRFRRRTHLAYRQMMNGFLPLYRNPALIGRHACQAAGLTPYLPDSAALKAHTVARQTYRYWRSVRHFFFNRPYFIIETHKRTIDRPTLMQRGVDYFRTIAEEFNSIFPNTVTTAAHGTPIGALSLRLCREDPAFCPSRKMFYAVDFMDDALTDSVGYHREVTRLCEYNARIDCIGDGVTPGLLQSLIRRSVDSGRSMILLLHPARIQEKAVHYGPY